MLLNLAKATEAQDGLFERRDDTASLSRMRAIDALNARYGRDTVAFGRTAQRRDWHLRSDRLSPRYTTHWDELVKV